MTSASTLKGWPTTSESGMSRSARTATTVATVARIIVIARLTRVRSTSGVFLDPYRAVLGVLLLPDRDDALELVDRRPRGDEGRVAERRGGDGDGREGPRVPSGDRRDERELVPVPERCLAGHVLAVASDDDLPALGDERVLRGDPGDRVAHGRARRELEIEMSPPGRF